MGEIIALDYGAARIGVARANDVARIPEPLEALDATKPEELDELIKKLQPSLIVLGLPRNLHGSNTQQTEDVLKFRKDLEKFETPVVLQDEALTTVMAEERKMENESTDSVAASIILEDYLRENQK